MEEGIRFGKTRAKIKKQLRGTSDQFTSKNGVRFNLKILEPSSFCGKNQAVDFPAINLDTAPSFKE